MVKGIPPIYRGRKIKVIRLKPSKASSVLPARFRTKPGAVLLTVICAVGILGGVVIWSSSKADTNFAPTSGRPFDVGSAWNLPVPANPTLDSRSSEIVSTMSTVPGTAAVYRYGVPVYNADSSTSKKTVTCNRDWGTCPFEGKQVPLDSSFTPSTGSGYPDCDCAMVVIDWSTHTLYEFYRYSWNNGAPVSDWGAVGPFTGSGRDKEGGRIGNAVGSGVSRLAGVVRTWELEQGVIDHALVFSTKYCALPVTDFRYPATKSDGKYSGTGRIPEGARMQLDPSINVDAIAGISVAEKVIAKALQKYGAYNIDCGGHNWSFIFEKPSGEPDTYAEFGVTMHSYGFEMSKIPWNRMRVLSQWDGCPCTVTPPPTPPPPTSGTSVTLTSVADTYVSMNSPTTSYGGEISVRVDNGDSVAGDNPLTGYLKFDLSSLAGKPISSAKLRIYASNTSTDSQNIKQLASNSWSESMTYNTRPTIGSIVATTVRLPIY